MTRKSCEQQSFDYETCREHSLKVGTVSELISVLSGVDGDLYVCSGLPISIVKVVEQDGQKWVELL